MSLADANVNVKNSLMNIPWNALVYAVNRTIGGIVSRGKIEVRQKAKYNFRGLCLLSDYSYHIKGPFFLGMLHFVNIKAISSFL